ncbi:MAG: chorismate mutase, partial [Bacteroidota bacterium]
LMIETHVDPANAMSDSDQQVDPETLFKIVNGLTQRVRSFDETNSIDQVGELRSRIDKLDLQLLDILVKRVELIGELGDLKRVNNVSVLQLERWKEIIDNCMSIARANGLNEEFVRNVFLQIHDEAIRLQSKMLQDLAEKGK